MEPENPNREEPPENLAEKATEEKMKIQECRMLLMSVAEGIGEYPIAEIITISLTQEEAEKHARRALERYFPNLSDLLVYGRDLGQIYCLPISTTVFFFTQTAGRIK